MIPPMLIATAAVFLTTTVVGILVARRHGGTWSWVHVIGLIACCLPALAYAGYYAHLVNEPVLLYRLRALPGSELLAGMIGFPTGWVGLHLGRHRLRVVRLSTIALASAPILLLIPYAKVTISPLDRSFLKDQWSDNVCLQSTSSTCGPSSAATLLRAFGMPGDEASLAADAHTSASGTEIWFLARALRARGVAASFLTTTPNPTSIPFPSIAGTRVGGPAGTGHFIAILGREGDHYVIGDPLSGRQLLPPQDIGRTRYFTGFFLVVEPRG